MDDFVKNDECPVCFEPLSCAADLKGKGMRPEPGDFSVCIHCASALVFDEQLNLRTATEDEITGLSAENRQTLEKVISTVKTAIGFGDAESGEIIWRKKRVT